MSSSLEKLRALTSRLDDRLAEKRGVSNPEDKPQLKSPPPIKIEKSSESNILEETINRLNTTQERFLADKNKPIQGDNEQSNQIVLPQVQTLAKLENSLEVKPDITVLVKAEESEDIRQNNMDRVKALYAELNIQDKSPDFDQLFMYKAMNLSGIGLKDDDFGEVRSGKYIQIIAITYEPDADGKKKAKNISLGYFGKGETIEPLLKNNIIEFVLCWRYEKAFQNVEHYKNLLARIERELKEVTIAL